MYVTIKKNEIPISEIFKILSASLDDKSVTEHIKLLILIENSNTIHVIGGIIENHNKRFC